MCLENPGRFSLAVLFASPVLARDEREPWVRGLRAEGSGATQMERWFAKSVLDGAIDHSFADNELPF